MRRLLRNFVLRTILKIWRHLWPTPQATPQTPTELKLMGMLEDLHSKFADPERFARAAYVEKCHELVEAQQMFGAGPWLPHGVRDVVQRGGLIAGRLREASPLIAQGALGDIELALQNVEWRREVNLSYLEFSRWGIQQIMLIARLYWVKNPIIRRLINVSSVYVFGRGVEVSSPDEAANEVIRQFFKRNAKVLGQVALTETNSAKWYDGNVFWMFHGDEVDSGETDVQTIDPLEIADIVCDPDNQDKHWYYRRLWVRKNFDPVSGAVTTESQEAYYPDLGYKPDTRPQSIGNIPVNWDYPVYHRRCGAISKWKFGCPVIYPALDWAKESRKFLEACAAVKQALSQYAMTLVVKGGQQAVIGAKQQMGTTVGPTAQIWDNNPPAIPGSTFASTPGATIAAFDVRGGGIDPDQVRRYWLMCCMTVGVPVTFLSDLETSNLATATSLDRPTELVFLSQQEEWREDLVVMAAYALEISKAAPSGKLREALASRGLTAGDVLIKESARKQLPSGNWVYEAKAKKPKEIEVRCNFPAIREGDIPALVQSVVKASTLDNRGGQFVGIDEKVAVKKLYELLGIENGDEVAELQYPESEYDPDRTQEILPPPIAKLPPRSGGPQVRANQNQPQPGEGQPRDVGPPPKQVEEALRRVRVALDDYRVIPDNHSWDGDAWQCVNPHSKSHPESSPHKE